jgi:chromosome segregation ATPase
MTDDALRNELVELRETMHAGFAYMHAGFARMDRYFELQQAQYVELRGEVEHLRTMLVALTARVDRIEERLDRVEARLDRVEVRLGGVDERLDGLENGVRAFRDWTTAELANVRQELRLLRRAAEDREEFRRDVAALDTRITRLENDWNDRRS